MSIEGRIAVDVSFADSATSDGVQSLKKITLTDTTSYTTGKVAIVTGTCGTAAVILSPSALPYKDATGSAVTFSSISRLAFSVAGSQWASCEDSNNTQLLSRNGSVCISDSLNGEEDSVQVVAIGTAGTASYTLVFYGT